MTPGQLRTPPAGSAAAKAQCGYRGEDAAIAGGAAAAGVHAVTGASQLANLLTALRLLLALPIVLLVRAGSVPATIWAAILFAVAGCTDLLDGYVARRWSGVSRFGAFLDPLADKCVIDGCIVALLLRSSFPPLLAAVFLGRDVAVTAMRLRGKGRTGLSPSRLAKAKTCSLYAGLFGLLLGRGAGVAVLRGSWLLVLLAAALSLVTAADYLQRLVRRPGIPCSFLRYLIFPRPGPLLSLGKVTFFLIGSLIALITTGAGVSGGSVRRWLLVFICYELIVSQGKYLINDLAGRGSDRWFLRGDRNRCPKSGGGVWLIAAYTAARLAAGIVALLAIAGWVAALAGLLTVILQICYELLKLVGLPSRGGWLFLVVSANYGLRAVAGMAAVNGTAPLSTTGLLVFLWAGALGALFLSIYWQRQGEYYLIQRQLSPGLLARYKPGVLAAYCSDLRAARCKSSRMPERLLQAMAAGGVLFVALGTGGSDALRGGAVLAYLCWLLLGLRAVRPRHEQRLLPASAFAVLSGVAAAAGGLLLRTTCVLPFVLMALAFLAYHLLPGGAAANLVMYGATDSDPAAA